MEQPVRVLIADDRAQARDGLRALLSTAPQVAVIGEAANGQEAVHLVEQLRPDVVLMDARMPEMDGLEATRLIKERWPEVKVVVLTMHRAYWASALAAGADVFLIKGCPVEDLLEAITEDEDVGPAGFCSALSSRPWAGCSSWRACSCSPSPTSAPACCRPGECGYGCSVHPLPSWAES